MKLELYIKRSEVPATPGEVYRWHQQPDAFERLTPAWAGTRVIARPGGVLEGVRMVLQVRVMGLIPFRWVAELRNVAEPAGFTDVQVEGPFASWTHQHRFHPGGPGTTVVEDRLEYALPGGFLGRWFGGPFVRRRVERLFAYRHEVLAREFSRGRRNSAATPAPTRSLAEA